MSRTRRTAIPNFSDVLLNHSLSRVIDPSLSDESCASERRTSRDVTLQKGYGRIDRYDW